MTNKELIEELKKYDDELEILIDVGDMVVDADGVHITKYGDKEYVEIN